MPILLTNPIIPQAIEYCYYLINIGKAKIISKGQHEYLIIKDNTYIYNLNSLVYRTNFINDSLPWHNFLSAADFPHLLQIEASTKVQATRQKASLTTLSSIKAFFTAFNFIWVEEAGSWQLNYTRLEEFIKPHVPPELWSEAKKIQHFPIDFTTPPLVKRDHYFNQRNGQFSAFPINYLRILFCLIHGREENMIPGVKDIIQDKKYVNLTVEKGKIYAVIKDVTVLYQLYSTLYSEFETMPNAVFTGPLHYPWDGVYAVKNGLPFLMFSWQKEYDRWVLDLSELIKVYPVVFSQSFCEAALSLIKRRTNIAIPEVIPQQVDLTKLWHILSKKRKLDSVLIASQKVERTSFIREKSTVGSNSCLELIIASHLELRHIIQEFDPDFSNSRRKYMLITHALMHMGFSNLEMQAIYHGEGFPLKPITAVLKVRGIAADYEKYYLPFLADLPPSPLNLQRLKSIYDDKISYLPNNLVNRTKIANKLKLDNLPAAKQEEVVSRLYHLLEPDRLMVTKIKNKYYSWRTHIQQTLHHY